MVTKNLTNGRGLLIFCKFSLSRLLSLSSITEKTLFRPDNRYAAIIRAGLSEIVGPELLMQLYRMPLFSVVKTKHGCILFGPTNTPPPKSLFGDEINKGRSALGESYCFKSFA